MKKDIGEIRDGSEIRENSLDDNEMNLRVAKEQLQILQKEKAVLVEQAKTLQSQLNETKAQFEHTRSSVYEEKKVIETALTTASSNTAIAEAQIAQALGYQLCHCQFPPTPMLTVTIP